MKKTLITLLACMFLLGTMSAFADVAVKKTNKKWCHRHLYKDEYYKARPAQGGTTGDCTWSNSIYASGSGGIIGAALNGTSGEYSGSGGNLIEQNYTWNADPPTNHYHELGIGTTKMIDEIVPGTTQQIDIVLPQYGWLGADDGTRIWELNSGRPNSRTKLWVYYEYPPQKGKSFSRFRRTISRR